MNLPFIFTTKKTTEQQMRNMTCPPSSKMKTRSPVQQKHKTKRTGAGEKWKQGKRTQRRMSTWALYFVQNMLQPLTLTAPQHILHVLPHDLQVCTSCTTQHPKTHTHTDPHTQDEHSLSRLGMEKIPRNNQLPGCCWVARWRARGICTASGTVTK